MSFQVNQCERTTSNVKYKTVTKCNAISAKEIISISKELLIWKIVINFCFRNSARIDIRFYQLLKSKKRILSDKNMKII